MSDTIKLIIEIPKDYYEALSKTKEIISSQRSGKTLMSVIYSAVANGTPLDSGNDSIKTVTNAEEAEEYQISDDISKGFEEFTKMMFKQGQAESEVSMSDNDYIAEYIKEKYPTLLGLDFAIWKLGRRFSEASVDMCKGIENTFNAVFGNKAEREVKPNE